jgi:hypothetical protein
MRILHALFCITPLFFSAMVLEATPAFAAHAFEMTIVPPTSALGFTVYRIDTATGAVASVGAAKYLLTSDPTPIPQGDYHLRYVQSTDGKSFWLYRTDSQTGRTWSLAGVGWAVVAEPK